jgi:hypothetical protein
MLHHRAAGEARSGRRATTGTAVSVHVKRAATQPLQRERPRSGDDADVADTSSLTWRPLRDLHAVGEADRTDLGVAVEGGADAGSADGSDGHRRPSSRRVSRCPATAAHTTLGGVPIGAPRMRPMRAS